MSFFADFAEVWSPPGFIYALGYSLVMAVMLLHEKSAGGAKRKWLTGLAFWLFTSVLMELTSGSDGLVFILTMLAVFTVMAVCLYAVTHDRTRALFLAVKTFICGELTASLCWQIYYLTALYHTQYRSVLWLNVFMFGGYAILVSVIWQLERRLRRGGVVVNYTARDVAVAIVVGLSVYIVSNLSYISSASLFSGTQGRDVFAIHTLVDMTGVALLYLMQFQLRELQGRLEKNALQGLMQTQYQAYRLSQESIELVNRKYHDLKHQIALLREQGLSPKGEAKLDEMEREIKQFEAQYHTGNPVLDTVLTGKSLLCQGRGIELKCIADGKALAMMDEMEIAALFGNMLDNAIESVERVEDPGQRLIRLYVAAENGFLRIRMENTCAGTLRFEDGLPLTTKDDARFHGFGMKSMRRTVEKYGGSLVAEQDENWFSLKILIPMNTD